MNNRIKYFFLPFTLFLYFSGYAQIDISESLANPKSHKFDKLDITVPEYLDSILSLDTSCCADVNVILKIQYDKTGTVTYVGPMSGTTSCAITLITDKAYAIRWDAQRYIDSKTIYLEINHESKCK